MYERFYGNDAFGQNCIDFAKNDGQINIPGIQFRFEASNAVAIKKQF
jgi:hypothetical protein